MNEFEILRVCQKGFTASFEKREALAFLELETAERNEEKCFSIRFDTNGSFGIFCSQLKRLIDKGSDLQAVEICGKVPHIVAIGDCDGAEWILALKKGAICVKEEPLIFLEKYKDK